MSEGVVTTGVDSLLELLKTVDRISLTDTSKQLGVPIETIQAWVDFLVEERIVGVEYKFTKPFIFLNKEQEIKKSVQEQHRPELQDIKKAYSARAKSKKIPSAQIDSLWDAHVREELSYLEPYFFEQTQKRGVQDTVERKHLWDEYSRGLMGRLQNL